MLLIRLGWHMLLKLRRATRIRKLAGSYHKNPRTVRGTRHSVRVMELPECIRSRCIDIIPESCFNSQKLKVIGLAEGNHLPHSSMIYVGVEKFLLSKDARQGRRNTRPTIQSYRADLPHLRCRTSMRVCSSRTSRNYSQFSAHILPCSQRATQDKLRRFSNCVCNSV